MKKLLFAAALALSGCLDPDSAETAPHLEEIDGYCASALCTWSVVTSGSAGTVALSLIENGDENYDCSQPTNGSLVCGVWTEYHDAFTLTDLDDAGETREINLDLLYSFEDQ